MVVGGHWRSQWHTANTYRKIDMVYASEIQPVWYRIGITPEGCQKRIDSFSSSVKKWGRYIDVYGPTSLENPTYESHTGRSEDLFFCLEQIQLTHLGVEHSFGTSREISETASQLGVDLFCGSWRDHALFHSGKVLNRQQCRVKFDQWLDDYRISLFFAFLSQNRSHAEQVSGYIGDDLYPDEGVWDRVEADRMVYWLISEFVGQNKAPANALEKIEKGRQKRPKQMLEILQAIERRDPAAIEKPMRELIKLFRTNEMKLGKRDINTIRIVTSIDTSVMWNLARMCGLEVNMPSEEVASHVITRESVGYA